MNTPTAPESGAPATPTDDDVTTALVARRPRMLAVTALALASGLFLAGCGGAGTEEPGSPETSESTSEESSTPADDGEDTEIEQIAVQEVLGTLRNHIENGEAEYASSEGNVSDESARAALRTELDAAAVLVEQIETYDELEPAREANKTLPAAIDAVVAVRTDTAAE